MILSCLEVYHRKDHSTITLHPDFVAVRSVCRLFRILVYDLPFWITDDVDITTLLPSIRHHQSGSHDVNPQVQHLENHLRDRVFFLRCLRRRMKWRFRDPRLLPPIFKHFNKNVISIALDFLTLTLPDEALSIDSSITMLGVCRNLASLEIKIEIPEGRLSLSLIAISCPHLKYLRIVFSEDAGTVEGNLAGFTTLEKLDIRDSCVSFIQYVHLPMSAIRLTRLSLLFQGVSFWPGATASEISNSLDSFVNLKSLSLSPLTQTTARWITLAKVALSDLRILN